MGTEFMTLGFLALLVFMSQYNGFFDALVDIVPASCSEDGSYDDDYDHRRLADGRSLGEDCFHLPASGLDWFHVFEIVHFSLFGGMCLYFVLMFGFVQGGVRKIRAWENIRYMDMESARERERLCTAGEPSTYQLLKPSMWGLLPQDHEYRCMQGKFVDNLIVMGDKDASFQRRLLERCGLYSSWRPRYLFQASGGAQGGLLRLQRVPVAAAGGCRQRLDRDPQRFLDSRVDLSAHRFIIPLDRLREYAGGGPDHYTAAHPGVVRVVLMGFQGPAGRHRGEGLPQGQIRSEFSAGLGSADKWDVQRHSGLLPARAPPSPRGADRLHRLLVCISISALSIPGMAV
jgi:hypothetical protein